MTVWADELLHEYGIHKKDLERRRDRIDRTDFHQKQDLTQINSMIESMTFSMDWMEIGRQPGTYKGADKRNIYQRQSFASMDFIPDITVQLEEGPKQLYMTAEEKIILADIFAALSFRERQCFILHEASGLSMGKIADEVGLKRRTVQQYIERAREKIKIKVG
ncbi:RNA polymerase sigma-70 factor [Planococcus halocryophilus Or1]|uniref:RNA polymerase subunit sigma-70 n=1 Tax=Planococcus halocryophilus TaxID=1215089 RepID=A0A1C7DQ54_9BACL|nr:sigma-70 family RNA polymerase sigma factor [Planococcus halocryophilus]ANU13478.1 RNA polymerase subunit sigma-70 [Planococcus halocryophilus]EMF46283.1 RNA polymerase sigma-70 factor [Planococcus halocryophilus Or1]